MRISDWSSDVCSSDLGGAASPTIRGLGSNTAVFSIEASVASFIDGVYAAHPRDLVSPLFDLERVVVLKGTQSTVLGKNTTLGEIGSESCRERVCRYVYVSVVPVSFHIKSDSMLTIEHQ